MGRRWTRSEDSLIKKYYPKEGAKVYQRLPGRSGSACNKRASKLGVFFIDSRTKWTEKEIEYLKKNYPTMGPDIFRELQGRNREACCRKASSLGIKFQGISIAWSEDEIDILKEYYPIEGAEVYKKLIGRSKDSCTQKAKNLGIKYRGYITKQIDFCDMYLTWWKKNIKQEIRNLTDFFVEMPYTDRFGKRICIHIYEEDNGEFRLTSDNIIKENMREIKALLSDYEVLFLNDELQMVCSYEEICEKMNKLTAFILTVINFMNNM